ncbi:MAG: tRNA 2-thiouridine(34) synthase MnmA [Candidatus Cloacimonetes bacterium]|nr:tRNA 2-thiouridine(34) synthase MnmA [Candidatus Cloacimonadota bacterium]
MIRLETRGSSKKKIVLGMSGGIDSSISLILLKRMGFDPVGVSLKLPVWQNEKNLLRENNCCTIESLDSAKMICSKFDVPYYQIDVKKDFQKNVIDYFLEEFSNERTPNPCFICNRTLKFHHLLKFAEQNNIEYVATGHYANIIHNKSNDCNELHKAGDAKKDQSYYLAFLKKEWLSKIIFPTGNYPKEKIYKIAEENSLHELTNKKESQDFCFVAGKSLFFFLKEKLGDKKGEIVHINGKILGEHRGIHYYTIGQRKGLNTPWNSPLFVMKLDKENNEVIVTDNPDDLLSQNFSVAKMNWLVDSEREDLSKIQVQVRYNSYPLSIKKINIEENEVNVILTKPHRAITPGQAAVFYRDDLVLGGGLIKG